jgi:3-hydroxyisobutyrate dehydrogenase-like beta-hydroxyacid dehydrogenase
MQPQYAEASRSGPEKIGMNIAFLGLGAMGSRMAKNLLRHDHTVTVWNRDREKAEAFSQIGATAAPTPARTVVGCEIAIAMVRDDAAAHSVWLDPGTGAFSGLRPGAIAIDCSTLSPQQVEHLAAAAESRGIRFLDAPVSGSRPQAEGAGLLFLVGGDSETVKEAEPVLLSMGSAVHHAGPTGAGAIAKLAVNMMMGVQLATIAELTGMLSRSGFDAGRIVEIMNSTSVASPFARNAAAAILARNFAPQFPLDLLGKDFAYGLGTAEGVGASMPIAGAVQAVIQQAISAGHARENMTALGRLYLPA